MADYVRKQTEGVPNTMQTRYRDMSDGTHAIVMSVNGSSVTLDAGTEVLLAEGSEVIVLAQSDDGTYNAIELDDDGQLKVVAGDIGVEGTAGYLVGYWQSRDLQAQILCELQKIAAQLAILTGEESPIGEC